MQFSGGKSMHGIYVPDKDIFIPFQMHSCISYFALCLPTNEELATCRCITFISELKWDPYSPTFAQEEEEYARGQSALSGEHFLVDGNCTVFAMSSHDHQTTVNAVTLAR
jgi:hypothetical protein